MSILRKLNTLMRAGVRESAERITEANAIRIYRQEVVDAENLLARRRTALAGMIATRKDLEKEIDAAQARISARENQIAQLPAQDRPEELLLVTARDIASTEAHREILKRRHVGLVERINTEEINLRKLLAEIREHRREVRILESQLASSGSSVPVSYSQTVAGHLATLRETRAGIAGVVCAYDNAESSMEEAMERVDGDPVQRELKAQGRDAESLHLESVLARLRSA